MVRTRIKICGVMGAEDALAAARAGADAIGMVFHPRARRCIDMARARRIVEALPAFVTPVALFVDEDMDRVFRVCCELKVRNVQLHGRETPDQVGRLGDLRVIKAIGVDPSHLADELALWRRAIPRHKLRNLAGIVLDTGATSQPGGTGIENDWRAIRRHQRAGHFDELPPIILAGGLTPQNVGVVVRMLRPWAVDVSSGVERTFGRKSPRRIAAFVGAVRAADAQAGS
jgi:phosphoribosylanthranilate isomerase